MPTSLCVCYVWSAVEHGAGVRKHLGGVVGQLVWMLCVFACMHGSILECATDVRIDAGIKLMIKRDVVTITM